ncbi:MAG TPA: hypothetical protein VF071_10875 [Candidatus Limnocylindria bacterium]
MTARLNDRDLNRLLSDWLDEGPSTAADFVVERAMARVPTVRRRGAASWLPRLLRTQGPLLASLAVLLVLGAAVALVIGSIIGPPDPPPSPPVLPSDSASIESSPSASEEARATGELVLEEIVGPISLGTSGPWLIERAQATTADELTQYRFAWFGNQSRWLDLFLDPQSTYESGSRTATGRLRVVVAWFFQNTSEGESDPNAGTGSFASDSGECTITFDTSTETHIAGSLECVDIPGTYDGGQEGLIESVTATFSFDPNDSYATPSSVP